VGCHLKIFVSITPNGHVCTGVMLSPIIPNFVKVGQLFYASNWLTKSDYHKSHFIFTMNEKRLTSSLVTLLFIHVVIGPGLAQSL